MKLYELNENYNNLLELLEREDVPKEMVLESLEQVEGDIFFKMEECAKLIRTWELQIKMIKEEEKRLKEKRNRLDKNIENLKEYMSLGFKATGKKSYKSDLFNLCLAKNPPKVVITDMLEIDGQYLETVEETKIDKAKILQDLKLGIPVAGCRMEQTESVRIR